MAMLRSHESVRTAVARRVEPGLAYWSPTALSDPRSVFPSSWEPAAQRDRVSQNEAWLQSRAAEAERRAREEAAALHLLMDAHAVDGLELVKRAQPTGQQQLAPAGQGTQGWLASSAERRRTGAATLQGTTLGTTRVADLLAVAAQVEEEEAVVAGGAAPPTPAALVLRSWSLEGDRPAASSRWSDRQVELSPLRPRPEPVETEQHSVHMDSRPAVAPPVEAQQHDVDRDSRPPAAPPAAAHVSVPVLLSQNSSASSASSMSEGGQLVDGDDGFDPGAHQTARLSAPRASASSLVHRSSSSASFVNAPLEGTVEPSDAADFGPIPCPAPEPAMASSAGKVLPLSRPGIAPLAAFPASFMPAAHPEPSEGETFRAPVCPPHTAPPPPPPLEVHHTSRHLQAPPATEVVRISSAGRAQHQWRSEQSAEPGTPRPHSPRASLDGGQATTRASFKRAAPPMDAPAEAPAEAEPAAPQPLPRGVPATMRRYIEACQQHGSTATPTGVAWSTPGFLYDADGDMRRCTVEWRSDRVAATDEGSMLWSLPYAQIEALWWSAHSEEEDGDVLVCAVDSSRDCRLCVRQRDAMLGAVCKHWATVLRGWRLMAEPTSDDPRPHGGDAKAGGMQLVLAQPESSSSEDDDDEA